MSTTANTIHDEVRAHYAAAAVAAREGACCSMSEPEVSAIIKATKPVDAPRVAPFLPAPGAELPVASSGCCGGTGCC